ncbi:efflux RND transporter periplasmic adaptor subunit [Geothrix sp. 21YS21S-4]|uniref:efflux RND transporter periplasmic adaptor subunit n=1 Tax=Geothrix sp. 21YS21S-4 TaxID=3068889 RepID=UPI0027B95D68|nr:efflux RND transporter periplasmic adaptor subunit [Geothrix sp. 21YS21S-4]
MKGNTKLLVFGGLGLAALIALGLAFGGAKDDDSAFSWDAVGRGDIRETISASGEVRAKTQVNIGTSVAGEIKAIHVKDGQDVKAGDLLVTIDQERLKQAMAQARAALEASRQDASRLEAARRRAEESYPRYESLRHQGLMSDEDFLQQKLARDTAILASSAARANVAQNDANLKGMEDGLSKATLRAPVAGRVTSLKAEKGETAIPGISNLPGAVLMIISDMSEMQAEIKVNESEVVRTKVGQTAQVTVESLPGKVFQGSVIEVATGTEKTGNDANLYKVKVVLQGAREDLEQLRPGMSARAVILTREAKNVLRIPLQAVLEREGSLEEAQKRGLLAPTSRNVALVFRSGKAEERTVDVGIANTQFFELKGGLAEGDKVLTGPIRKLKDLKDRASVALRSKPDSELAKLKDAKK